MLAKHGRIKHDNNQKQENQNQTEPKTVIDKANHSYINLDEWIKKAENQYIYQQPIDVTQQVGNDKSESSSQVGSKDEIQLSHDKPLILNEFKSALVELEVSINEESNRKLNLNEYEAGRQQLQTAFSLLHYISKSQRVLPNQYARVLLKISKVLWLAVYSLHQNAEGKNNDVSLQSSLQQKIDRYTKIEVISQDTKADLDKKNFFSGSQFYTYRDWAKTIESDWQICTKSIVNLRKQKNVLEDQNKTLQKKLITYKEQSRELQKKLKSLKLTTKAMIDQLRHDKHVTESLLRPVLGKVEQAIETRKISVKEMLYSVYNRKRKIDYSQSRLKLLAEEIASKKQEEMRDRSEIEDLFEQRKVYEEELVALEKVHADTLQEHVLLLKRVRNLQILYKQMHQQKDRIENHNDNFTRCNTPRPDWKEAAEILPGLATVMDGNNKGSTWIGRGLYSKANKPSVELLKELVKEVELNRRKDLATQLVAARRRRDEIQVETQKVYALMKRNRILTSPTKNDFNMNMKEYYVKREIMGFGSSIDVPKYLRYEGKLVVKLMSKTNVNTFIEQLWISKSSRDSAVGQSELMSEHIYTYLQFKFPSHREISEFSYSFMFSLFHYAWDPEISIFHKILNGEIPEESYKDYLKLIESTQKLMVRINIMEVGKHTGFVLKEDLTICLPKFFPNKSEDEINLLVQAIERSNHSTILDINKLTKKDSHGRFSPFMKLICTQHLQEIIQFKQRIRSSLNELDMIHSGQIMILAVPPVLQRLDPKATKRDVDRYMAAGLNCRVEDLHIHMFSSLSSDHSSVKDGGASSNSSSVKFVNVDMFYKNLNSTLLKLVDNYKTNLQPTLHNKNSRRTMTLRLKAVQMWEVLRKRVRLAAILKKPLRRRVRTKKKRAAMKRKITERQLKGQFVAGVTNQSSNGRDSGNGNINGAGGGGNNRRRMSLAPKSLAAFQQRSFNPSPNTPPPTATATSFLNNRKLNVNNNNNNNSSKVPRVYGRRRSKSGITTPKKLSRELGSTASNTSNNRSRRTSVVSVVSNSGSTVTTGSNPTPPTPTRYYEASTNSRNNAPSPIKRQKQRRLSVSVLNIKPNDFDQYHYIKRDSKKIISNGAIQPIISSDPREILGVDLTRYNQLLRPNGSRRKSVHMLQSFIQKDI